MKIMNADGTYTQTSTINIPTNHSQYAWGCSKLIGALSNLENNPNANVGRSTTNFVKGFSIVTHQSYNQINHAINHYLLHAKQVTVKDRIIHFKNLCQTAYLDIVKIQHYARDYRRQKSRQQWRNHLEDRVQELEMNREMDSEWFFNSYQHIECGHLIYELRTGKPYPKHKQKSTYKSPKRMHLKKLGNQKRYRFIGTFVRSGFKSTYHGNGFSTGNRYAPTLLLKNVMINKSHKAITNHLWLNYTKGFCKLGQLKPGTKIIFNARVSSYLKGYGPVEDKTIDYDLSFPTKVTRQQQPKQPVIPMPINNKNALIGYVMEKNKDFYLANNRPFDEWYVKQYHQYRKHTN